jgi:hypothetical protein
MKQLPGVASRYATAVDEADGKRTENQLESERRSDNTTAIEPTLTVVGCANAIKNKINGLAASREEHLDCEALRERGGADGRLSAIGLHNA